MLEMSIDPSDPTPAYEQIVRFVVDRTVAGSLTPGEKLPTVRALAAALGLAVNTVAKAYRELEMRGAIETRGRAGTFVTGRSRDREAAAAAHEYVVRARALGLSESETLAQVRRALGIASGV